ncbi:MAG: 1,6-anhydro-N-acetylmuramyl-L-alanine amidase AmpD [Gammaproteobacteria bacterium]|nr:1,6-anhydro-N-acetylmuramyl-L-alanine amidase AmpD [Gammaproteobacteria bacterium]
MSEFQVDIASGLIRGARYIASPNCDDRPDPFEINLLVVHGISLPPNEFGGPWIEALFTNSLDPDAHPYFREIHELRVSSHLLIRRDGELLQFVPFNKRAWHAGVSNFCGRERCNDYSIGIELEGTDELPYEEAQYRRLAEVVETVQKAYPEITRDRIVGHSDIAPGRKTDPGPAFSWEHFAQLLDKYDSHRDRTSLT